MSAHPKGTRHAILVAALVSARLVRAIKFRRAPSRNIATVKYDVTNPGLLLRNRGPLRGYVS